VDAHIRAAGGTAHGGTTFDPGGRGIAAARAEDRWPIGPYVLVRILGEGGMGQVWLAEQTAPVKRQVALKLIKVGLYGSAVIQRFESERQSLAVMNHPAIAKVFDTGATKDGQPYFVMEYVDGPPITRYFDNKKLKIRERLELFIKVCEGVQHAHQKAIVHRDLKPSSVLVTEVDGKPVPRIIDVGVAKAISSQPGAEQTQFTEMGALIGTRGFISPEQAEECLGKLILLGEGSLRRALRHYEAHFHEERNHQGKDIVLLFPLPIPAVRGEQEKVRCRERLGGLLKYYEREPA
jgi:serine/threonine protein kinase